MQKQTSASQLEVSPPKALDATIAPQDPHPPSVQMAKFLPRRTSMESNGEDSCQTPSSRAKEVRNCNSGELSLVSNSQSSLSSGSEQNVAKQILKGIENAAQFEKLWDTLEIEEQKIVATHLFSRFAGSETQSHSGPHHYVHAGTRSNPLSLSESHPANPEINHESVKLPIPTTANHIIDFGGGYHHHSGSKTTPRGELMSGSIMSHTLARNPLAKNSNNEPGDTYEVINQYTVIDEIGRGAHGFVMLAVNSETQDPFAIKAVQKPAKKTKFGKKLPTVDIEREIRIMKNLRHKNVVRLHEVIEEDDEQMLYLVMDYMPNGAVLEIPPNSNDFECIDDEALLVKYAIQIAEGLSYCHRRKVVHRDIKPDNILLRANDEVCISDFGVSYMREPTDSLTTDAGLMGSQGTPAFFSPEACRGEEQTSAADVWSFGVTLFAMKFGQLPFPGSTVREVVDKILSDPIQFPTECTPEWKDLLSKMMEKDASKRMTLKQFAEHKVIKPPAEKSVSFLVTEETETNFEAEIQKGADMMSMTTRKPQRISVFTKKFSEAVKNQMAGSLGMSFKSVRTRKASAAAIPSVTAMQHNSSNADDDKDSTSSSKQSLSIPRM